MSLAFTGTYGALEPPLERPYRFYSPTQERAPAGSPGGGRWTPGGGAGRGGFTHTGSGEHVHVTKGPHGTYSVRRVDAGGRVVAEHSGLSREDARSVLASHGIAARVGERTNAAREVGGHASTLVRQIHAQGGFTFQPMSHDVPKTGIAFSPYRGLEHAVPVAQLNARTLKAYVSQHAGLFHNADHYLGAWHNTTDGKVYLDVSVVSHNTSHDHIQGLLRQYDQLAAYNLGTGEEVQREEGPQTRLAEQAWSEGRAAARAASGQPPQHDGRRLGGAGDGATRAGGPAAAPGRSAAPATVSSFPLTPLDTPTFLFAGRTGTEAHKPKGTPGAGQWAPTGHEGVGITLGRGKGRLHVQPLAGGGKSAGKGQGTRPAYRITHYAKDGRVLMQRPVRSIQAVNAAAKKLGVAVALRKGDIPAHYKPVTEADIRAHGRERGTDKLYLPATKAGRTAITHSATVNLLPSEVAGMQRAGAKLGLTPREAEIRGRAHIATINSAHNALKDTATPLHEDARHTLAGRAARGEQVWVSRRTPGKTETVPGPRQGLVGKRGTVRQPAAPHASEFDVRRPGGKSVRLPYWTPGAQRGRPLSAKTIARQQADADWEQVQRDAAYAHAHRPFAEPFDPVPPYRFTRAYGRVPMRPQPRPLLLSACSGEK